MKSKKLLFTIFILGILLSLVGYWFFSNQPQPVLLQQAAFNDLPGWKKGNHTKSLATFQASCRTLLRQNPNNNSGSQVIQLKIKDWHPACKAALKLDNHSLSNKQARKFFTQWFLPVEFHNKSSVQGLFTGYYMPLLRGSLVKTSKYHVPIYGIPDNLVTINLSQFNPAWQNKRLIGRLDKDKMVPFYPRKAINQGAMKEHAPVLAWITSPIDRVYLEIQGSGIIKLPNGEKLYLGYAGENGLPYTSIAQVLINKGVLTRDTASMQAIRRYLESHPQEMDPTINQNKSFVFFKILNQKMALGAQGIDLTPGYSLAVDRQWIPLGTPLWLSTTYPTPTPKQKNQHHPLQRLMVAQDTGGAIRGMVRGDVYWGDGKPAEEIAGKMKNKGFYWLLLPKQVISQLPKTV